SDPGCAGQGLRGRGDRGAARGRREGPPAHPVEVQLAMVRRHAEVLQLVRSARPEGSQRLPDVRPPDGRAAPLRRGPVRAARLATPIAVLALPVAGCGGGSKVVVREVPGGSVDLTVTGGDALAPSATPPPTPTVDASATTTPDASGTQSGGAAT